MDVVSLIDRAAEQFAGKMAVVYGDRRLSFREVYQRSNQLANALISLGVTKEDRIATIRKNCPQHVEIAFALYICGSVHQILNPRLTPEELVWQLTDCEAKALIFGPEFAGLVGQLRDRVPSLKHLIGIECEGSDWIEYEALVGSASGEPPRVELNPEEPANIVYTSGTTGQPKGIVRNRRSELAVARNLLLDVVPHMSQDDVFLALQPLYHGAGAFVLPCWIRGVTHVIVPGFEPEIAFEVIRRERVSVIKTVPTVYVRMLAHREIRRQDFSRLHTLIYGASPMPVDKLREGMEIFGPVFVQLYGQSEAPMTITVLRREEHILDGPPEVTARLRSAGRPFTLVDVRVVDEKGTNVQPGQIGEIILRGDHIMTGYWKLPPERTAETLRDGWIHTRDMGTVDDAGFVYLLDRISEMIITGGLNVYPNEVEQVLYQHPAVLEAAVIGVADPEFGEAVKACVVLRPGVRAEGGEILEFCRGRLPGYKRPRSVDFFDELPKNAAAKILRRKLRDQYR